MGLPSHQHQNPNTIPPHQHRIQVPSHPISIRLSLPSHPINTRRRLPSHPINAFLRVSHPIPSHQCISSCFPSHRITIIKESDSHPIFVMVKLKKIPACGGLSDGIPSHVVPSAPRIALRFSQQDFVSLPMGTKSFTKSSQDFQIAGNVLIWQNLSPRFSNGGHHENLDAARKSVAPLLSLGDKR